MVISSVKANQVKEETVKKKNQEKPILDTENRTAV